MKKSIKMTISILVLMMAFTAISYGQDEMKINRRKNLTFDGESKKAEIKVSSTSEYNFMVLNISCQLSEGQVTVEIVDPKGDLQGTYTVKMDEPPVIGNNTKSDQMVSGQMMKSISKPINGDWIVRAKPTNAKGKLSLNISQGFEPKIDMVDIKTLKNP